MLLAVLASLSLLVCLQVQAAAAVINFDDLTASALTPIPSNYAGLAWGTSTDDSYSGFTGAWYAYDDTAYSTPNSPNNYVYNGWGANNLWFSFPTPVASFNGAWFAAAYPNGNQSATEVRVHDDLGNVSAWLGLTAAPQFLAADFAGSTTIWVERDGHDGSWYTMDDVKYNEAVGGHNGSPELSTWMLLACSGLAGVALRRRRKA